MRSAIIIALRASGESAEPKHFAEVSEARALFKELASSEDFRKGGYSELQLWESDGGMTKRKKFGNGVVRTEVRKFNTDVPKDDPDAAADPEVYLTRKSAVLAAKHNREILGVKRSAAQLGVDAPPVYAPKAKAGASAEPITPAAPAVDPDDADAQGDEGIQEEGSQESGTPPAGDQVEASTAASESDYPQEQDDQAEQVSETPHNPKGKGKSRKSK